MTKLNLKAGMENMAETIERHTAFQSAIDTQIPGLSLFRREEISVPLVAMYEPSVCLIAQGAKRVYFGYHIHEYNAAHFLFSGMHLPVTAHVIEANSERPYLGLRLSLDLNDISQLMIDHDLMPKSAAYTCRGMETGKLTLPMVNAFQRLIELLDNTEEIPVLAPLIQKEILFRLICSEQGGNIGQFAMMGARGRQIARVVNWLRSNFEKPVNVDELAEMANMGVSTFHHHFRKVTALSPLQYQKRLRLQEARMRMISDQIDATTAAFQVGYESPSQFSREYSRLYGAPPARDIADVLDSVITTERA